MKKFQRRRQTRNLLTSWVTLVALLVAVFVLGRSTFDVWKKSSLAAERRSEQIVQLRDLEERRDLLEEELTELRTERGVEAELRDRFQIGRPGEEAVIILGDGASEGTIEQVTEDEEDGGFWRSIFPNR